MIKFTYKQMCLYAGKYGNYFVMKNYLNFI